MGGPHPASTSLDCPPALAGPDHRPHSQEQRNQSSEKSQSLECHRAPIPWGEGGVSLTPPPAANHCRGRRLCSGGAGHGTPGAPAPPLAQENPAMLAAGVALPPAAPLLPGLGLQLRVFQEIQATFPSRSLRPKGPSGERQSIFEEKGGEGAGCGRKSHQKKKKNSGWARNVPG